MAQATRPPPAAARAQASTCAYPAGVAGICTRASWRPVVLQAAAVWQSRWVSTPMITSASPVRRAIFSSSQCDPEQAAPAWKGNARGNPVMGHSPTAGQAPDQANEGGQAGAGNTRDKPSARHATGGQLANESPGTTRHQPWPIPAPTAGTEIGRASCRERAW